MATDRTTVARIEALEAEVFGIEPDTSEPEPVDLGDVEGKSADELVSAYSRDELDAYAEAADVEQPSSLPNKGVVADNIVAALK